MIPAGRAAGDPPDDGGLGGVGRVVLVDGPVVAGGFGAASVGTDDAEPVVVPEAPDVRDGFAGAAVTIAEAPPGEDVDVGTTSA